MFSVEERNAIRDWVQEKAVSDERVTAGAVVGSLALSDGDRWSDLDLTFGVADGVSMFAVLEDWTQELAAKFGAVHLFDLPSGPSIYRVFLMPGCLQFDLSFTPAAQFGAMGPKFRLLFGQAVERKWPQPPPVREMLGYAVHHALRARFCIERDRLWQAEYWISGVRDLALTLACRRRGLPGADGRGFDDLPAEVLEPLRQALVSELTQPALQRALAAAIDALLREAGQAGELAQQVEPALRQLGER